METALTDLSALEIAHRVQSGQVTADEVTRDHLKRIAALDGRLSAFQVVCTGTALAEAAALDARDDLATLPLAGVPVAIKDNLDPPAGVGHLGFHDVSGLRHHAQSLGP